MAATAFVFGLFGVIDDSGSTSASALLVVFFASAATAVADACESDESCKDNSQHLGSWFASALSLMAFFFGVWGAVGEYLERRRKRRAKKTSIESASVAFVTNDMNLSTSSKNQASSNPAPGHDEEELGF